VLGVIRLTVKNNAEQEFTHQDETFLQEIANKLARSLDARWLAEGTDRQLRKMEREAEWQEQLRRAAGLPEVSQVLCDQFLNRTQARGAHLGEVKK
jgi:predicted metal-dependent peptidase